MIINLGRSSSGGLLQTSDGAWLCGFSGFIGISNNLHAKLLSLPPLWFEFEVIEVITVLSAIQTPSTPSTWFRPLLMHGMDVKPLFRMSINRSWNLEGATPPYSS